MGTTRGSQWSWIGTQYYLSASRDGPNTVPCYYCCQGDYCNAQGYQPEPCQDHSTEACGPLPPGGRACYLRYQNPDDYAADWGRDCEDNPLSRALPATGGRGQPAATAFGPSSGGSAGGGSSDDGGSSFGVASSCTCAHCNTRPAKNQRKCLQQCQDSCGNVRSAISAEDLM